MAYQCYYLYRTQTGCRVVREHQGQGDRVCEARFLDRSLSGVASRKAVAANGATFAVYPDGHAVFLGVNRALAAKAFGYVQGCVEVYQYGRKCYMSEVLYNRLSPEEQIALLTAPTTTLVDGAL